MPKPPDIPRLETSLRLLDAGMRRNTKYNGALEIAAACFRTWNGLWIGLAITPWGIHLLLLPGDNPAWRPLASGEVQTWPLAGGSLEFVGLDLPDFGHVQVRHLPIDVLPLTNLQHALAAARREMENLLSGDATDPGARRVESPPSSQGDLKTSGLSRRNFLRGRLSRR